MSAAPSPMSTAFDEDQGELVAIRKYLSDPAQPGRRDGEHHRAISARDFGADRGIADPARLDRRAQHLLEGKGVRVGLLTTRGFRDVYEIGRQWRGEDVFNIFAPAPKMLLTRDRIFEIGERIGCPGRGASSRWLADDVAGAASRSSWPTGSRPSRYASCSPTPIRPMRRRRPRSSARIAPGSLRIAVPRGQSGMARIRAHGVDRGQRLYRPAGLALPADAGGAVAPALSALPRADDEIRRRRGERRACWRARRSRP